MWPFRAEEFSRAGLTPPRCEGLDGFWDRFTFTQPDRLLFYADSNSFAGRLTPAHYAPVNGAATARREVHLVDTHHDRRLPRTQLVGLLHPRGCRFQYGTLLGHVPRLENDGSLTVGRKTWDVDRLALPDQDIELRVCAGGHFHGRFLLEPTPGHTPLLQARLVAVTLDEQAGFALRTTWHPYQVDRGGRRRRSTSRLAVH
ncbi:hypothetical protein [Streptomyces sp. NPDC048720]|uniref:hypothetical protein n=1 Tax=Streptomyces sp. NPDC048720 TaxID=3365588 RepID=UPI003712F1CA